MKPFKLDIQDIRNKKSEEIVFREEKKLGSLDFRGQKLEISTVLIKGSALNIGDGILLRADVEGNIKLECSRCLKKFDHKIKLKMNDEFSFTDTEAEHVVHDNYVDISSLIIEYLALELDIKTLCKEDCAGLCTVCGKDLNTASCSCNEKNVDRRWYKLQELLESKKDKRKEK